MTLNKRLAYVLLTVLVLFSMIPVQGAFIDTVDKPIHEAVNALYALGVLDGYEDNTFRPDEYISRADFAKLFAGILGVKTADLSFEPVFSDVPQTHDAYIEIMYLNALDIMTGTVGGVFLPDEHITFEQACKVIVTALGYAQYAEEKGGYPAGYLTVMAELKLLKAFSAGSSSNVTRGDAAALAYLALSVDLMTITDYGSDAKYKVQKGATLLSERLHLEIVEGQITANEHTSLTSANHLGKGKIRIGSEIYNVGDTKAEQLLGYHVILWLKEDSYGEKTAVWVQYGANKNQTILINAEDIVSSTLVGIQYLDVNDYTQQLTLSSDLDIVYNGAGVSKHDKRMLNPLNGDVLLLDTNGDHVYDVAFVRDWHTVIVEGINTLEKIIYTKSQAYNGALNIGRQDTITKNGRTIEIWELREWDVLAVMETEEGVFNIEVSTQQVQGSITEVTEDKVFIGSQPYQIDIGCTQVFYVGDTGRFYMTINNKIAAFSPGALDGTYGYLYKIGMERGSLAQDVKMRILTQDNQFVTYSLAKKLMFNGKTVRREELLENTLLYNKNRSFTYSVKEGNLEIAMPTIQQLIVFYTNEKNEIIKLETSVNSTLQGINDQAFSLDREFNTQVDAPVNATRGFRIVRHFVGINHRIGGNTKIFLVPEYDPRYFEPTSSSRKDVERILDEQEYTAGKSTLVGTDVTYNHFQLFDTQPDRSLGAMVIYTTPPKVSDGISIDELRREVAVVDNVTKVYKDDGLVTYKVSMFQQGRRVEHFAKDDEVTNPIQGKWSKYADKKISDLQAGDVIQFNLNEKGEIINFLLLLQKDFADPFQEIYASNAALSGNDPPYDRLYTLYATVNKISGNNIGIVDGDKERNFYIIARTNIYLYNSAKNQVMLAEKSDLEKGDKIFVRTYDYQLYTVVIYR